MFRKLLNRLTGNAPPEPLLVRPSGDPQDGPLITFSKVTKAFGAGELRTLALDQVDLEVCHGEFIAVNGPSGCGKSTLLSIAGLLETPSEGTYLLNGTDVGKLNLASRTAARNREIGFVFQSFNLIGDLSVTENIELPLTYQGMAADQRKGLVGSVLERFDLEPQAQQMPSQLSGGHQQRVAVARAVVGKPAIVLADEPTGNLNSEQAEAVIDMLTELNQSGSTILLVTHDPRWLGVASRSVELFDGKVLAS